jgi:hypothetical protein
VLSEQEVLAIEARSSAASDNLCIDYDAGGTEDWLIFDGYSQIGSFNGERNARFFVAARSDVPGSPSRGTAVESTHG